MTRSVSACCSALRSTDICRTHTKRHGGPRKGCQSTVRHRESRQLQGNVMFSNVSTRIRTLEPIDVNWTFPFLVSRGQPVFLIPVIFLFALPGERVFVAVGTRARARLLC